MSKYKITLDGKTYEMEIERIDGNASVSSQPKAAPVSAPAPVKASAPVKAAAPTAASPAAAQTGGNAVVSPMPGTIIKLLAAAGDTVKKGQAVLVLEAMKMENEIAAPKDGKIAALHVAQGDAVQGGAALFEIAE